MVFSPASRETCPTGVCYSSQLRGEETFSFLNLCYNVYLKSHLFAADAVTVSGTPETVTFAAALLDIFDKTVTARMQEYDVLGNSPATYFICGVWANRKRGREQAKNGNANPVLLSQLSYQKTGKSAKIRNDFDKKSFRIFLKKSSAAQIAAACRMASACPPAVQWHYTAFQ